LETHYIARKGVDTGIIPVDYVANMIVLTGGNCNLKGINGKKLFYLNACSPSTVEPKWDTFFDRGEGKKLKTDIMLTYKNDLKAALNRAETEGGYSKRKMILLKAFYKQCHFFTRLSFHDWTFETNNQDLLYDGLNPKYRMTMPICYKNSEERNAWVDEILFKIGGKNQDVVMKSKL
jgi:hypothetical protein